MAIKSSGSSLAISEIAAEFGGDTPHAMSEYFAGGDNVPSGTGDIASSGSAISMSSFYGTSNRITIVLTISGNTDGYNIFSNKGGTYSAGISDVKLVNNGNLYSDSGVALDTGSGWASGDTITIDNNSLIVGHGGDGGAGGNINSTSASSAGAAGQAGSNAINLQFDTTIDNTGGTISGGSGGGGGGGSGVKSASVKGGTNYGGATGGGGGGGRASASGGSVGSGSAQNSTGAGSNGSNASITASGAGGAGGSDTTFGTAAGGAGGAGGANSAGAGSAGGAGTGSSTTSGGAGGAAGKAINLNGNSVTYTATGTIQGAVS